MLTSESKSYSIILLAGDAKRIIAGWGGGIQSQESLALILTHTLGYLGVNHINSLRFHISNITCPPISWGCYESLMRPQI